MHAGVWSDGVVYGQWIYSPKCNAIPHLLVSVGRVHRYVHHHVHARQPLLCSADPLFNNACADQWVTQVADRTFPDTAPGSKRTVANPARLHSSAHSKIATGKPDVLLPRGGCQSKDRQYVIQRPSAIRVVNEDIQPPVMHGERTLRETGRFRHMRRISVSSNHGSVVGLQDWQSPLGQRIQHRIGCRGPAHKTDKGYCHRPCGVG